MEEEFNIVSTEYENKKEYLGKYDYVFNKS